MSEAIVDLFEKQLTQYDYELLFIDNDSSDQTRPILREICKNNEHIKAILMQRILDNSTHLIWNVADNR